MNRPRISVVKLIASLALSWAIACVHTDDFQSPFDLSSTSGAFAAILILSPRDLLQAETIPVSDQIGETAIISGVIDDTDDEDYFTFLPTVNANYSFTQTGNPECRLLRNADRAVAAGFWELTEIGPLPVASAPLDVSYRYYIMCRALSFSYVGAYVIRITRL